MNKIFEWILYFIYVCMSWAIVFFGLIIFVILSPLVLILFLIEKC